LDEVVTGRAGQPLLKK